VVVAVVVLTGTALITEPLVVEHQPFGARQPEPLAPAVVVVALQQQAQAYRAMAAPMVAVLVALARSPEAEQVAKASSSSPTQPVRRSRLSTLVL
jgi:hypothetical protein